MEAPALPAGIAMPRGFFALVMMIGLAAGALRGAQQPEFRAATPTVSIDATVLDRRGQVVTDLTVDDFEVYDNGRRQAIEVFDNGLRPIAIVVMLDRSASVRPHFGLVRDAAKAFVANLLPGDRVRIGSFADRIRIDPDTFTDDRDELNRILDDRLLPEGGTPLWSATARAFDALAGLPGRRVVLLFTDGRDTPAIDSDVTFRNILDRARTEEAMVYAIGLSIECPGSSGRRVAPPGVSYQFGPRGPFGPSGPRRPGGPVPVPGVPVPGRGLPPRTPPSPWTEPVTTCRETKPDPDLRELTDEGGGGYFELRSTDDLAATFARVAYELHSQYLLGFTARELDGRTHAIDVRVKRPDVSVRARRTYIAAVE